MKARPVTITPVLNGYKVQVGCQELVFEDFECMVGEIDHYFRNPYKVEKGYLDRAVSPIEMESPPRHVERAGTDLRKEEKPKMAHPDAWGR